MVRSIACATLALIACLGGACLSDPGVHCADGTLCPADTTCAALAGVTHCVTAAQQAACAGAATGAPCDLTGTGDGVCNGGACIRRGCRDGFLSADEKCDGTLLGDETCESRGYHGGVLACHDDCTFDVSACSGICGDGVISDAEDCDPGKPDLGVPADLGGATCAIGGFYQPDGLACSEACRFEFAACGGGRDDSRNRAPSHLQLGHSALRIRLVAGTPYPCRVPPVAVVHRTPASASRSVCPPSS